MKQKHDRETAHPAMTDMEMDWNAVTRRRIGIGLAATLSGFGMVMASASAHAQTGPHDKSKIFDVTRFGSIQLAIRALVAAGGGVLYFPTGEHVITGHHTISNVPVKVCGDGVGLSVLRCSANSSLRIVNTVTTDAHFAFVSDLSIWAMGDFTGLQYPALLISYNTIGPFRGQLRCTVERVEIRGHDPAIAGFHGGINLVNCINATLSQVNVIGKLAPTIGSPLLSRYGAKYDATPGEAPVEFHVENSKFYYVVSAIKCDSEHVEGVVINQCTGVIVSRFVDMTNTASSYPMLVVTSCHAAFQETGVYAVNFNQTFVSNNLLYAITSDNRVPSPVGVFVSGNSEFSNVHHNTIVNSGVSSLIGVVVDSGWVDVSHNMIDGFSSGIWLRASSTRCSATFNTFRGPPGTAIVNQGSANTIRL
jgi:hypothetical protein